MKTKSALMLCFLIGIVACVGDFTHAAQTNGHDPTIVQEQSFEIQTVTESAMAFETANDVKVYACASMDMPVSITAKMDELVPNYAFIENSRCLQRSNKPACIRYLICSSADGRRHSTSLSPIHLLSLPFRC